MFKGYLIRRVEYPELIDEIGRLRVDVWKNEKGMNQELMAKGIWIDASDEIAIHWVVFKDRTLVGSARLTIHENLSDIPYSLLLNKYSFDQYNLPVSSMNRLAIHADHSGQGIAKKLDELRINTSRELGAQLIIGEPVSWRIDCLEKLGFETIGPLGYPEEAPGLMLTLMIKKL